MAQTWPWDSQIAVKKKSHCLDSYVVPVRNIPLRSIEEIDFLSHIS